MFESNPYPTVQGSIWTLIHEALCYGLVFLCGLAGVLGPGIGAHLPDILHGLYSEGKHTVLQPAGRFSYGLYVYAFPVQGLVVWLFGPVTPAENILLAFPATLLCAVLSWHLIEAPALAMRFRPVKNAAAA